MIVYRVRELWEEKQRREKRRITLVELSLATGVNRNTLSRLVDPVRRPYNTTTDVIDKLCRYFDCQPGDLMVYVPDEK
ncbi:transcriptional regulator, XRE family [Ammonifex degensii KC4]|uniref:Transcriptional regulator, XRE family n=1 Tax=Ammonifex degensii (strain DSM 10501 / KC4) TaxID=429009 RepID=C9RBE4_AMMDK|nr:helix-turn-helix transcriptional regulator [Ammonifex degensii]ACX51571.1 transcriptional regulator, XRE family [Ammonifex degensii KC4]